MSLPLLTLITDQLPWPPRNGITLPLVHHLEELRSTHALRVVLLADVAPDAAPLAENEARYGAITVLRLLRHGLVRRVWDELRGCSMAQHGWTFAAATPALPEAPALALVSPMSAVARWRAVLQACPSLQPRASVALVNDCTTAEYRWRFRSAAPGLRARLKARLDAWRAPGIGRIEARLLAGHGRVLLQTEADLAAMRTLVGEATARRCVLVPNGVREDLFTLALAPGSQQVLFVAELGGEYGPLTAWLCAEVWPRVRAALPGARLQLIGRNASPGLRAAMAATPGVAHLDHAPDLAAAYAASAVVWSPVFKGFGLINKSLEAMAAARPVVGGRAAFNGIAGFVPGQHGLVLERLDAAALAETTLALLAAPERRAALGEAARALVRGAFSWPRSAQLLRQALADSALPAAAPAALANAAAARPTPRHG
jgi:glycosyltransferase involved in cell wall biosynthesis